MTCFYPGWNNKQSVYDTYFAQYCVRKQFLIDKEDPFLEFLQLIKNVYHPSFEPKDQESTGKEKQRKLLQYSQQK